MSQAMMCLSGIKSLWDEPFVQPCQVLVCFYQDTEFLKHVPMKTRNFSKASTGRMWAYGIALFSISLAWTSCSSDSSDDDVTPTTLNEADRTFIMNAGYGNQAEISAGQKAVDKGVNASLRMYGQMMITDHTTNQNELLAIGQQVGVTPPSGLDSAHQALAQQLSLAQTGKPFDSLYITTQVSDHDRAIQAYQNEINNGNDSRIKEFAVKYLPALQRHRLMADSIRNLVLVP